MPDKFKNRYRIAPTRLRNWDYSRNGAYFITICTAHRQHYFGEITNFEMQLSSIGEYANKCWLEIPDHFPHFYLDAFTIMPDHVHGILVINKPAETKQALALQDTHPVSLPHFRFRNQGRNTVSGAVGSFKAAVTKYCNENHLAFGWQTRFHDHIIRNSEQLEAIRNYIINNPRNWKRKEFRCYSRRDTACPVSAAITDMPTLYQLYEPRQFCGIISHLEKIIAVFAFLKYSAQKLY